MGDLAPSGKILSWPARLAAYLATARPLNTAITPILVDIMTEVIPNERLDRIEALVGKVQARLDQVDPPMVRGDRPYDPIFPDLLQDGCLHATRVPSFERLDYIAAMIVNGISRESARRLDHRYLMQLFGELNDVEVLFLILAGKDGAEADAFWRRHVDVLAFPMDGPAATPEELDRAFVYESYFHHLERLRVVRIVPLDASSKDYAGKAEDGYTTPGMLRLTTLGEVLLRAIGEPPMIGPRDLRPIKLTPDRVGEFWKALRPHLDELLALARANAEEKQLLLRSGFRDINFDFTCEGQNGQSARVGGYYAAADSWIWVEGGSFKKTGAKNLIHLGADDGGWYWEHGRKRRASLPDLARLMVGSLLKAIEEGPASN